MNKRLVVLFLAIFMIVVGAMAFFMATFPLSILGLGIFFTGGISTLVFNLILHA